MAADSKPSESPYAGLAARIRPEGSCDAQALAAEKAARQPIVRVLLTPGAFILRPLVEPCKVHVDGESVGTLAGGRRLEATLAEGTHQLQIARGRLRRNRIEFTVQSGEISQFLCTAHHSWLDLIFGTALFFALVLPGKFFRVRPFRP